MEAREHLKKLLAMSTQVLGPIYAIKLQNANCRKEAMELLTKLLTTSKQIDSSDCNNTKEIVRVKLSIEVNGCYQVLKMIFFSF